MRKIFVYIASLIFYINILLSDNSAEPYIEYKLDKQYTPEKISNNQIIIDGILNESVWDSLYRMEGLEQADPILNGKPSENTDVKICYDDESIYIGVFLYNDNNEISYKKGSDDDFVGVFDSKSDYFIIEFDPYHDHQTSYAFAVNSSGVKADYMIYDDGYIDDNWGTQWESSVNITNKGWEIEYSIPFKSLRLNTGDNLTWGINIIRYIKNINEYISWVVIPTEKIGTVSKYGHLNNLNIQYERNIQFNPHMLTGKTIYDDTYYPIFYDDLTNIIELGSNPQDYYEKFKYNNIGFNLKYSLKSNSSFDFTYNPDFEQINQDPSEVNNTPYETFFEEKRNFFLEDALFFNTPIKVFYSRRIGGNRKYNEEDNFYSFFQTKLEHATKYTFKDNKLDYGFMIAQSEPTNIRQANPLDNKYFYNIQSSVARISHVLFNNKSKIGVIGTNFKTKYNTVNVYGYDYSFNLMNDKLFIDGQLINSDDGFSIGIGNNFEVGFRSNIFTVGNKILYMDLWYANNKYDKNLNINDLGYLFRNNLKEKNYGLSINNDKDIIKSKYVFQHYIANNYSNDILSDIFSFNYDVVFKNHSYLNIGFSKENEYYKDKFYDDYFNLDLNKIVKSPNSKTFNIIYGNDILKFIEYSLSFKAFKNDINDEGEEYLAHIILKPKKWMELALSYDLLEYYETYHFLKIREPPISNAQPPGPIWVYNQSINHLRLDENPYQYIFTNSNNRQVVYTAQLSSYINNVTLKLYTEYFVHKNMWNDSSNQYYVDEDFINYSYPYINEPNVNDELVADDDKILYNALYSSAVANFVIKWKFFNNSNLYFLYSLNKAVNGIEINTIKELIEFKNDLSDNNIAEILYDKSLFIKCEFYFNP